MGSARRTYLLAACLTVVGACTVNPGGGRGGDTGAGPEVITTKTGAEMVAIPGGWFEMGSGNGSSDEKPAHRVHVGPFLMDRYEVTQAHYAKFPLPDPSHFKDPKRPVEMINWNDAAVYCNERSLAEGFTPCYDEETWECDFEADGYRLPTEAEWEYACRAGTRTAYSFGGDPRQLAAHAWFKDNARKKTQAVGTRRPNPWGIHDMHGNVAEWCNDRYDKAYYARSADRNPRGGTKGTLYVVRGGSWHVSSERLRSSARTKEEAGFTDSCLARDAIGFRCVRPVREATPPAKHEEPAGDIKDTPPVEDQPAAAEDVPTGPTATGFVYDDIYLAHGTGNGFPESPARLKAIVSGLRRTGLLGSLRTIPPASDALKWIQGIHPASYVARVRRMCARAGEETSHLVSSDVPVSARSFDVAVAAVAAVAGVLGAVDAVMDGKARNAFCAVRPPGHHALPERAMGFCVFNNVAVAAHYLRERHGLARILVIDWDVHHGNGTQDIFYDDPGVFYFGVHQSPLYPGTGAADERGEGRGKGATLNVPLPAGTGDERVVRAFEEQLVPAAGNFAPQFILISAGFDAHAADPLGGMAMTADGFARITRIVKRIADEHCGGRIVSVLEGGYDLEALADSVDAHVRALME